ncbi:1-aminocyclopropane-1-carboxylate deaminase/D-cysteine desulfhydrase [Woeseia oceani]|nr:pyridoxal-phosphate dependent enzyme [Woeseia oceani]
MAKMPFYLTIIAPQPIPVNNQSMSDLDELQSAYPVLGQHLPRLPLTSLPTPVRLAHLDHSSGTRRILIKQDDRSSLLYGGNKVRKLEYMLAAARRKGRQTIATFGTTGSHHALATALYARQHGFANIAFLSRQTRTLAVRQVLNMHQKIGSELVPFDGDRATRIATLRRHLRGRNAMIIPAGGSSWLGTMGFVNAALELSAQIGRGVCDLPQRLYVATGTMGTAVGLALGFALVGVPIDVHAVRISHSSITNDEKLARLAAKTVLMMRRLDKSIPPNLAADMRLTLRHEFFGEGYAQTNAATEHAIRVARRSLNLKLEPTYTGKAMAAMLADLKDPATAGLCMMFWQSYHTADLPVSGEAPLDRATMPAEFLSYFS